MLRPGWPDGHSYSPVPSPADIARGDLARQATARTGAPGVSLPPGPMLRWARKLGRATAGHDLEALPGAGRRYGYADPRNDQFNRADAALLTAVVAQQRPARIVEIGSGFSTAVMLDALAAFALPSRLVTIDPDHDRLRSLVDCDAESNLELVSTPVQDVDLSFFERLRRNDVLFIDSSHVAKSGSDVVYELLEIVPRLARGVNVHLHDVFPGFDYPRPWLEEGRYWNEQFVLRALLVDNRRLRVTMWPTVLRAADQVRLASRLPILGREQGGSIWMRTA